MSQKYALVVRTVRHWTAVSFVCAGATLSAGSLAADLFRWTDSKGTVHFTDKPPKGVEAEKLTLQGPAVAVAEEVDEQEDQQAIDHAARNAERCAIERERLNTLRNSREIRMQDENGGIRVLSEAEVKTEIDLSSQAIVQYCTPA